MTGEQVRSVQVEPFPGSGGGIGRLGARFRAIRSGRPIASASVGALAVLFAGAGISYGAQLAIARLIGPDSFGVYAYVLAWVTLLAYFSTLGFHVSLLRLLPAYRATDEWPLARGVIRYSRSAAAAVGMAIAIVGAAVLLVREGTSPEMKHAFLVGLCTAPVIALQLVEAATVRAFGGAVEALIPERIIRDSVAVLVLAAVALVGFARPDASLAMAAMLVSSAAALALAYAFMRRLRPPEICRDPPAYAPRDWCRPTFPLTVIMVADNVMIRSGVIVLGLAGSTRDAGVFAVAFNLALLTALPRMAVASIFAPTVSDLYVREDHAGLQALSARAASLSLAGTAVVALPLLLLAPMLLGWFGSGFSAGAPVVVILVLGQLFSAAAGPQQHLITMTGHESAGATIFATSAAVNFAACLVAVRYFGMTGAAIAMTASLIAWNLAMGAYIRHRLQLAPGLVAVVRNSFGATPGPSKAPG
jgi:O-antigen/teichoic acid export membrane protein